MATLSGNKIKDTYQSLIKFNDNGTADGTLQLLSDGAGNDALFIDVGNAHLGPKRSPVLGDCGAHSLCAPCDQGFSAC